MALSLSQTIILRVTVWDVTQQLPRFLIAVFECYFSFTWSGM